MPGQVPKTWSPFSTLYIYIRYHKNMQKKRRPIPMQHDFSANVCGNEKDAVTLHYKTTGN